MTTAWKKNCPPPYGFECEQDGTLHPSEVEQAILLHALRSKSEGSTNSAIAAQLNTKGFQTRNGNPWNRHSLARAIKSYQQVDPGIDPGIESLPVR